MKRRKWLAIAGSICLIIVLAALLLPGCAKETAPAPAAPAPTPAKPTPAPTPAPAPSAPEWLPEIIKLGTTGEGATGYALGISLIPTIEDYFGVPARTIGIEVIRERAQHLRDGLITSLLEVSGNINSAMEGTVGFADDGWGPQQQMGVWTGYVPQHCVLTTKDSPVKSIYDLKGKRIAFGAYSPSVVQCVTAYVAFSGLTLDDVTLVPFGSWAAIQKSLVEGKVDVTYCSTASSTAYEMAAHPKGIRALELPFEDTEGWARFSNAAPGFSPGKVTRGPESVLGIDSFRQIGPWLVYPDANEEFVYQFAKCLHEQHDYYKGLHPSWDASVETTQLAIETAGLLWHPSAIRYFKEIGIWSSEIDSWHNEKLDLWSQYRTAWDNAVKDAEAKGIKVSIKNDDWMALWDSYRAPLPRQVTRIKE